MAITKKLDKKCIARSQYLVKCEVVLNHEPYESARDIITSVKRRPSIVGSKQTKKVMVDV